MFLEPERVELKYLRHIIWYIKEDVQVKEREEFRFKLTEVRNINQNAWNNSKYKNIKYFWLNKCVSQIKKKKLDPLLNQFRKTVVIGWGLHWPHSIYRGAESIGSWGVSSLFLWFWCVFPIWYMHHIYFLRHSLISNKTCKGM